MSSLAQAATTALPKTNINLGGGFNLGGTAAPKPNGAVSSGLSIGSGGQALVNGQAPVPYTPTFQPSATATSLLGPLAPKTTPPITPTSTGGVSFHPSYASLYDNDVSSLKNGTTASNPIANSFQDNANKNTSTGLAAFLTDSNPTSGGGSITTDGNGQPVGYAPANSFNIDASGAIDSSALGAIATSADLGKHYSSLNDFVNGLAQAQGYSPQYVQALQGQYGAQTQGAELGLNAAQLNSNLYTGAGLPGDTMNYAQGATAKAQAQNSLFQAQNNIQQLAANQALNTAQLERTGNIAAAQTQLQYNPIAVSGENDINRYNALQQQYPAADLPDYNPALSPGTNTQIAQELISNSPAYRAQFQSTFQTPGGGTGIYNKLDVGGLPKNSDGTISLVNAGQAALQGANAGALTTQVGNYNNVQTSFNTANKTLATMIQFMQKYGINDNSTPILNQLENKAKAGLIDPGAIAAYQADIAELDTNYATILARGGSVAGTNDAAASLINPNLKPSDLQLVLGQLTQNGQNALDAIGGQISGLTGQLGGQASSYASTSGGDANPFSAQNFFGQ